MRSAVLQWGARKCANERKNQCPLPSSPCRTYKFDCSNLEPPPHVVSFVLPFCLFSLWLCVSLRPEGVDKAE